MTSLHNFPFCPIEFNKEGNLVDLDQIKALKETLRSENATDLLVISHGWNNDKEEAHALYDRLLKAFRTVMDGNHIPGLETRKFAVLGVFWPSKKFADAELIPGGAASTDSGLMTKVIRDELERLKGTFDGPDADAILEKAKELVPFLESVSKQEEFSTLIRSLLPSNSSQHDVDEAETFRKVSGKELFTKFEQPLPATILGDKVVQNQLEKAQKDSVGSPAGIGGQFLSGIKAGALNILNFTTYYQMKERAGKVGQNGLRPILKQIKDEFNTLKLHLIGHSFGGRLVTAAVADLSDDSALEVQTLSMLQAAFSHYGLSDNYESGKKGFFNSVIASQRVKGPIVISHTRNDIAVGKMYPLASRLAGQIASALGDANDKYGGIGSNGAQRTTGNTNAELLALGGKYQLKPGAANNIKSDTFIKGHSDITHPEVAYAILSAVATT